MSQRVWQFASNILLLEFVVKSTKYTTHFFKFTWMKFAPTPQKREIIKSLVKHEKSIFLDITMSTVKNSQESRSKYWAIPSHRSFVCSLAHSVTTDLAGK